MTKRNAAFISLLLGIAIVLGAFAATETAGLAQHSSSATPSALRAGKQRLDRLQAEIRRARESRPPALPSASSVSPGSAPTPSVQYVRPQPIVVAGSSTGEHEGEHEDDDDWGDESDD